MANPAGRKLLYALSDRVPWCLRIPARQRREAGPVPRELPRSTRASVVCSSPVSGSTGPMGRKLPGYDFAIQALSELMSITGPVEGRGKVGGGSRTC